MAITRYRGQPLPIVLAYPDNPLTIYGKTYEDIEEISMNFKKDLTADADDLYWEATSTAGGVILDESTNKFIMATIDYTNVEIGRYHLVLAIKVRGIVEMIEPMIRDDVVKIIPDKQRA